LYLYINSIPKIIKKHKNKKQLNNVLLCFTLKSWQCFNVSFKKYFTPGSIKLGLAKSIHK